MTEPTPLHVAMDVRAGRTVLATVQADRVIDTRRLEHGPLPSPALLAEGLAVLCARAPGPIAGLAGIWRHTERLGVADPGAFSDLLSDVAERAGLPSSFVPHGAALALGEWLRAPSAGPLGALTLDVGVAGGVVIDGRLFAPHRLDLGHLSVAAEGCKCACSARGCLHGYASEWALQQLARDFDVTLEEPSAVDWQVLMASELAARRHELARFANVLGNRSGRAIGIAAAHLADTFGVVEVRVRTRHPDLWRLLAPAADDAARQVSGTRAPELSAADASEDAFFTGAVAAGR